MSTSELFLDSFARIERHLRSMLAVGNDVTFYRLVDSAATRSSSVRHYQTDLKEFADLRNAIVHERTDGHVIAEPLQHTALEIKAIADILLKPPSVLGLSHRSIAFVRPDDSVGEAVSQMSTHSFSQLPVVGADGCSAVLTPNTITRWLGAHKNVGIVSIEETPVRDVLSFQEPTETHRFLPRSASVFDVMEAFHAEHARGRAVSAILVTQQGRANEALLGIVTLSDLPAAYASVGYAPSGQ